MITLTESYTPHPLESLAAQLWSLKVELSFYLLVPVVSAVLWRLRHRVPETRRKRLIYALAGAGAGVSLVFCTLEGRGQVQQRTLRLDAHRFHVGRRARRDSRRRPAAPGRPGDPRARHSRIRRRARAGAGLGPLRDRSGRHQRAGDPGGDGRALGAGGVGGPHRPHLALARQPCAGMGRQPLVRDLPLPPRGHGRVVPARQRHRGLQGRVRGAAHARGGRLGGGGRGVMAARGTAGSPPQAAQLRPGAAGHHCGRPARAEPLADDARRARGDGGPPRAAQAGARDRDRYRGGREHALPGAPLHGDPLVRPRSPAGPHGGAAGGHDAHRRQPRAAARLPRAARGGGPQCRLRRSSTATTAPTACDATSRTCSPRRPSRGRP